MRDQEVLRAVSDGLSGLDLDTPAEEIIAAGNARRRRRLAAGTVAGMALAAGLAVAVPFAGSGPAAPPTAQRPASLAPVDLAAFSVVSNPNGTVTLTLSLKQLAEPDEVREALSAAGVPAVVRVGSVCYSVPAPGHLERVFSDRMEGGKLLLVITPSGIPKGAVVNIGYKNSDGPVQFGLAWKNKLICSRL
ncbi:hypothetical protein ACGFI9_14590 [Micromonospora sp. NPDC048930]|uniref:hypothetical protein n=1 Tax=Micromonospora sp. NPDC048930 TaxID=3364261 RepID=UPI0037198BA9